MWAPLAENRWERDGSNNRQLLLHANGLLAELHGTTVHIYQPAGGELPEQPLATATWQRTETHDELDGLDDEQVWEAMDQIAHQPPEE